jgi:hypothetical protein
LVRREFGSTTRRRPTPSEGVSVKLQRWLVPAVSALLALALLYWVALPPLAVERTADGVKVHVERLGEYNSALTEFVIFDGETESVVVRLVPREKMIAMWTLQLREGSNAVAPSALTKDPGYLVLTPASRAHAILKKGHLYNIEVTGFSMFGTEMLPIRLRRTKAFVL